MNNIIILKWMGKERTNLTNLRKKTVFLALNYKAKAKNPAQKYCTQ